MAHFCCSLLASWNEAEFSSRAFKGEAFVLLSSFELRIQVVWRNLEEFRKCLRRPGRRVSNSKIPAIFGGQQGGSYKSPMRCI